MMPATAVQVLAAAGVDEVLECLRLDGQQRLGPRGGPADEREMHDLLERHAGRLRECAERRHRVHEPRLLRPPGELAVLLGDRHPARS